SNKERKSAPSKLNGGGNFTDYTADRLKKDINEKDLNMLVSGFIDGKLIYILEFPFNSTDFVKNLQIKINRWQQKMAGSKSTTGQFLRSADFSYKDYIGCENLKIVYLLNKTDLENYKPYIVKDFYFFLEKKAV
ncbi:MAG: hypothetical protein NC828_04660, partial [Candidatus Omnitrophica bacterium]|nr:hypothetical protein [Candidatus Omnitrophota bacterium]